MKQQIRGGMRALGPGAAPSPEQQLRRDTGPLTGKGQARRADLLAAARHVFERDGFLEARVADIVAEAAVAQGTFYTYFDSKDAIFREVATEVVGEIMEALHRDAPPVADPYDRAYAAMERFVDAYGPHAKFIALIEQVGTFTPEMKRLRLQVREAFVDRAARGIQRQQEVGIADDAVDPVMLAEVLGAMVDHVCYVWLNLGKDFEKEALLRTLTLVWTRAIGAPVPSEVLDQARKDAGKPKRGSRSSGASAGASVAKRTPSASGRASKVAPRKQGTSRRS